MARILRPSVGVKSSDDPELLVSIESDLPSQVVVGRGNLLLVHGWCVHARLPIRHLELLVGGEPQPLLAEGTARADIARRLPGSLGRRNAGHSGFLGFAALREGLAPGSVEIRLAARLAGGRVATRRIGDVRVLPGERKGWAVPSGMTPRIAICMATFNPPADLFRSQIDSIRAQSYDNWICFISDDHSSPEAFEMIGQTLGDDPRFQVHRNPRRLGVYRNFEQALGLVPAEVPLVALADQDDRWDRDKLASLVPEIQAGATLAYSDARVVDADGRVLAPTFWTDRTNNSDDLGTLLLINSITGAASLFRSELLDYVLPFPATEGLMHDHWLALVAMSLGDVAYVGRPLYDYVQHSGAALGHEQLRPRRRAARPRLRSVRDREGLRRVIVDRLAQMRRCYYVVLGVAAAAKLLLLRLDGAMDGRKERAVRRCATLDRSPAAWAWLAWSLLSSRIDRSRTRGVERLMLIGALWQPTQRAMRSLGLPPAGPHGKTMAVMLRLPHANVAPGAAPHPETIAEESS